MTVWSKICARIFTHSRSAAPKNTQSVWCNDCIRRAMMPPPANLSIKRLCICLNKAPHRRITPHLPEPENRTKQCGFSVEKGKSKSNIYWFVCRAKAVLIVLSKCCDITLWTLSVRGQEWAENKRMSRSNPYAFRYLLSLWRRTEVSYRAAKISFDGSHYIATPKENFPQGHKRRRTAIPLSVDEIEKKEQFEAAYKESQQLPKKERKAYMRKAMEKTIPDKKQRREYIELNNERKKTNAIRRKVRLSKKANLQEWSYFCTVTYFYGHWNQFNI